MVGRISKTRSAAIRRTDPKRTPRLFFDAKDSLPDQPVFNRAVALRDSWAKAKNKQGG